MLAVSGLTFSVNMYEMMLFITVVGITTFIVALLVALLFVLRVLRKAISLPRVVIAILVALLAPLAMLTLISIRDYYQLSMLGWLGIQISGTSGSTIIIVRYYADPFAGFREDVLELNKLNCTVKLVHEGDGLWPTQRVWGFKWSASYGLFSSRNGTLYSLLSSPECENVGLYVRLDGIKLFMCDRPDKIRSAYDLLRPHCKAAG